MRPPTHPNDIVVKCINDYTKTDVIRLFEQVFAENKINNFFLSFDWIGTWLEQLSNLPELLTFSCNNKILGFVFVGCQKSIFGNIYLLNQTGYDNEDQVWIEYNDIISLNAHKACAEALLANLYTRPNTFKLIISNAAQRNWESTQWATWSNQAIPGYETRLNKEFVGSHYSKNTKNQLHRAKKYITRNYGEVRIDVVQHIDANRALKSISKLHFKKWGYHALGSGFSNPKFVDFHTILIKHKLNSSVHILKFTAGEFKLGYLYYFSDSERVYFYLSAINYKDINNNYKPGIVMHTLAMQYFADLGFGSYDFLAGYARYKTSLSNCEYRFNTIHLFRNKWYYWPLRDLVSVKRWFNKTVIQKVRLNIS
jgi:hypothetical protein